VPADRNDKSDRNAASIAGEARPALIGDQRRPPAPSATAPPVPAPPPAAAGPAAAAPARRRGPWHPRTHLELLHAPPAAAVIAGAVTFALVAARGLVDPSRLALLVAMLAANQYSAGVLNDVVDAADDAAAGRGKPIQRGEIGARVALALAVGAGVASIALSVFLGPAGLAVGVGALACAWSYDLWLKRTPASALPFAVAVPLVPLAGYVTAGRFPAVLWWLWPMGALAAVAIHLADALPDVESDRRAGVDGLAPRLGVRRAALLAGIAYAAAVALAAGTGVAAGERGPVLAGTAAAVVLGVAAAAVGRRGPAARRAAYALLLLGVIAVAAGWAIGVQP
jgi:4-hydroxybenzoate polyprenyltransferase